MTNKTLRVGVIQQPAWPDKAQSLAETERLLKQIVCVAQQPLEALADANVRKLADRAERGVIRGSGDQR